jgi:hypothetical protein
VSTGRENLPVCASSRAGLPAITTCQSVARDGQLRAIKALWVIGTHFAF